MKKGWGEVEEGGEEDGPGDSREEGPPWPTLACFLYLDLRFWNQILTWVWVRPRAEASSALSGRARYWVLWNLSSSCWIWPLE